MYNRQPTPGQEGRMRIIPENGDPAFYAKVEMADNPLHEGTPLSKETLLQDATAELFGLPESAVPDDVLAFLGKYNQHWWWRKATTTKTEYREIKTQYTLNLLFGETGLTGSIPVTYSSEISISSDCTVSLKNPVTISVNRYTDTREISGNYVLIDSVVYYIPSSTSVIVYEDSDNSRLSVYCLSGTDPADQKVYTITAESYEIPNGEESYVRSSDRNAYPDSGESDGYEWRYLGVPFENAVTAPKIETGSYVGTGKFGLGNENKITFSFTPAVLFVGNTNNSGGFGATLVNGEKVSAIIYGGNSVDAVRVTWEDKTVSWYHQNYAFQQMNQTNTVYNYVAIG